MLPEIFRPLLWSYDFSKIDPEKDKKIIIVNGINYGDLRHWRWLTRHYGKESVREVLERIPATEIKLRTRALAEIIFSIRKFNDAPRGLKR